MWWQDHHYRHWCETFNQTLTSDHIYVIGISHAYGGALSALSIDYALTPVATANADTLTHKGQQVWVETEVVKAIYEDRDVVLADDERHVEGDFA